MKSLLQPIFTGIHAHTPTYRHFTAQPNIVKSPHAYASFSLTLLAAMKSDRKRLKAEKADLVNQMQQLYATLESREEQLRDFIRNYEQHRKVWHPCYAGTKRCIKKKRLFSFGAVLVGCVGRMHIPLSVYFPKVCLICEPFHQDLCVY